MILPVTIMLKVLGTAVRAGYRNAYVQYTPSADSGREIFYYDPDPNAYTANHVNMGNRIDIYPFITLTNYTPPEEENPDVVIPVTPGGGDTGGGDTGGGDTGGGDTGGGDTGGGDTGGGDTRRGETRGGDTGGGDTGGGDTGGGDTGGGDTGGGDTGGGDIPPDSGNDLE